MPYRRIRYAYARIVSAGELDPFGDLPGPRVSRREWRPAADLMETREGFEVRVELADVRDDDVEVVLYPDALLVQGIRRCPASPGARFHSAEIRYGPFRTGFALPVAVDVERMEAALERGLLTVKLPRAGGGAP